MKNRIIEGAAILITAAMIITISGCTSQKNSGSASAVQYHWVASNDMAVDSPNDKSLKEFGRLLNEKSGGRITLDVYSGGSLQSEIDSIAGMQMGTVDFVIAATPNLSSFTDTQKIWDLPYLFEDLEQARKVARGPVAQKILDRLSNEGMKGLCYWENGMVQLAATQPVHSMADLKGMKVRSMNNEVHTRIYECYGAHPVVLSWGDIYTSLQQGTINAISSTSLVNMFTSHFEEVAPYIIEINQQYGQYALCMSEKVWNGLPDDIQKIVVESALEAQAFNYEISDQTLQTAEKKMKEGGAEFIQVDMGEFAAATEPVYAEFVGNGKIDPSDVEAIRKAAGGE